MRVLILYYQAPDYPMWLFGRLCAGCGCGGRRARGATPAAQHRRPGLGNTATHRTHGVPDVSQQQRVFAGGGAGFVLPLAVVDDRAGAFLCDAICHSCVHMGHVLIDDHPLSLFGDATYATICDGACRTQL